MPDTSKLVPSQFTIVMNHDWQKGMRSSIRVGLREIDAPNVCVQPVDVPGVDVTTIRHLIQSQIEDAAVPVYQGARGTLFLSTKKFSHIYDEQVKKACEM